MSGKDNYKELPNDTTLEYNEMVNNTTERFQKEKSLTEKKTAEGLKILNPETPKYHITPKIQKENNPRRPVINCINCHTSEILCFLDQYL